jgi:hypothetical protein
MRTFTIFLLVVSAWAVRAEERCLPSQTPRECLQRLVVTRAYENAEASVAGATTGPASLSSPIRSAVKDFLSVASAHVDGSSVKDSGTALIVDYNVPHALIGAASQLNFEVTLADAVASPAVAALTVPQSLGRGDDVAASISYNIATEHFGLSLMPQRKLADSLLYAFVANGAVVTPSVPATSADTPFVQLFPNAAERATAIVEFENASIAALPAAAERVKDDLARLAKNQPQLFATFLYHHRNPLVGPKERGVRVTWEIGSDNINAFRRAEGGECETRGDCLAAFTEYAARTARTHRSGRLSLAVEYHVSSENSPAVNPAVTEEPAHGVTYLATYGQEITSFLSGRQGRVDVALTYDGRKLGRNVTSSGVAGPTRVFFGVGGGPQLLQPSMTRYAAAGTITQPLPANLAALVSVVWAQHFESFPATTGGPVSGAAQAPAPFITRRNEIGFHAGMQYKLPQWSLPQRKPNCCCCEK